MKRYKSIFIIFDIIILLLLVISSSYAWMVNLKRSSNNFDVTLESNIDGVSLVGAYTMNDANYDGVFDVKYEEINGNVVAIDANTKTLSEQIDLYYSNLNLQSNKHFSNMFRGAKINYRVVLESSDKQALVNLFLPNVSDVNDYSFSMIFKITSLSYFNITKEQFNQVNTFQKQTINIDKNLWDFTHLETMLDQGILLESNSYLFIDFTLECFVNDDNYLLDYYNNKLIELKNRLIELGCDASLSEAYYTYLVSDITSNQLSKTNVNYTNMIDNKPNYILDLINIMYDCSFSYKIIYERTHTQTGQIDITYEIPGLYILVKGN